MVRAVGIRHYRVHIWQRAGHQGIWWASFKVSAGVRGESRGRRYLGAGHRRWPVEREEPDGMRSQACP